MEQLPNDENVHYLDEYPELHKKVWLRRLARQREVGVIALPQVIKFPDQTEPDEPA